MDCGFESHFGHQIYTLLLLFTFPLFVVIINTLIQKKKDKQRGCFD